MSDWGRVNRERERKRREEEQKKRIEAEEARLSHDGKVIVPGVKSIDPCLINFGDTLRKRLIFSACTGLSTGFLCGGYFSFLNDEGKLNFSPSKHFIRNSLKSIGNGMMLFGGFSMLYTLSKYGIMYARQKSGFVNNLGGLIVAGIPFYRSTFMRRGFIFVAGLIFYDVVTDFAVLFRK